MTTASDKRKGLQKVQPEVETRYDMSLIAGQDPRDILYCSVEVIWPKESYVGNFVFCIGQDLSGMVQRKYGKKSKPNGITIKSFKVVGRRNHGVV